MFLNILLFNTKQISFLYEKKNRSSILGDNHITSQDK